MSGHQSPFEGASNDWLTPPEIIKALGPFDLDPCASVGQPWETADRQITLPDDGLAADWGSGLVWCNPPFGPHVGRWLRAMREHGNGIALVAARTETRWFRDAWEGASAMLFLFGRPYFHLPVTGERARANSGVPVVLIAFGPKAADRLAESGIAGWLVTKWTAA